MLVGFSGPSKAQDTLDELAQLVETAGGVVVGRFFQRRQARDPGRFLSRGKMDEAANLIAESGAALLVSDEDLTPAQVRHLGDELKVRVLDRSELILDIFARRAQSREAKLQVELAQLRYLLPRLAGMWGHLSRTGGGIGTRGPGETQLEVDRRRVRQKIATLVKRLEEVKVERAIQSQRRRNAFRISLVGYTNAGKSTIFNRLAHASVLEEDRLFATLDTTTRRVILPGEVEILLSDTVGFIRKLPHHLIASFRATLKEVEEADLLLHVADVSHPARDEQIAAVEEVLEELIDRPVPRLLVLNKADRLRDETAELEARHRFPEAVLISALRAEDKDVLRARLAAAIRDTRVRARVQCPEERRAELGLLLRRGELCAESYVDGRVLSEWWLDSRDVTRLERAGFTVKVVPSGIGSAAPGDASDGV